MAFNINNFTNWSANGTTGISDQWAYNAKDLGDTLADIQVDGYFNGLALGASSIVAIDDLVYVQATDGNNIFIFTALSPSVTIAPFLTEGEHGVEGPDSSVDNSIALFSGTTGKLLKDSTAYLTSTFATFQNYDFRIEGPGDTPTTYFIACGQGSVHALGYVATLNNILDDAIGNTTFSGSSRYTPFVSGPPASPASGFKLYANGNTPTIKLPDGTTYPINPPGGGGLDGYDGGLSDLNLFVGTEIPASFVAPGNTSCGVSALKALTTGVGNTAAGAQCMPLLTSSTLSTGYGFQVGQNATTFQAMCAFGASTASTKASYTNGCLFGLDVDLHSTVDATISDNFIGIGNNVVIPINGPSSRAANIAVIGAGLFDTYLGFSKPYRISQINGVTTNATPNTYIAATSDVITNTFTVTKIRVQIACYKSDGSLAGYTSSECAAYYNGTSVQIIGTPPTVTFTVSGTFPVAGQWVITGSTSLQLRCTGVAATTINWTSMYEAYSTDNNRFP